MSSTALLVIDVQVAMFEEAEQPHEGERMLANIAALQKQARARGVPVMFVRHCEPDYPAMTPGSPSFEVHPAVAPMDDELIFDKYACDSFYGTGLATALRERDVERLVITGMQTEMCIDTASRSALHQDFDVLLVADGHATWSNPVLDAAQIVAHHNKTLAGVPHPSKRISVKPAAEIEF